MNRWWAAGSAAVLCLAGRAQVEGVPRDVIEQRIEAAAEKFGGDADVDLTNLFEVFTDHYLNPIDLNHTNAQELSNLILLNDAQIGSILTHIKRYGKLLSVYELQAINGIDAYSIGLIRPFITVRENARASTASFKEILDQGSH